MAPGMASLVAARLHYEFTTFEGTSAGYRAVSGWIGASFTHQTRQSVAGWPFLLPERRGATGVPATPISQVSSNRRHTRSRCNTQRFESAGEDSLHNAKAAQSPPALEHREAWIALLQGGDQPLQAGAPDRAWE
jgi:hypothetical protein